MDINNIIEIVRDPKKRKLRARSVQDGRWVRFPNKLRVLNKTYLASQMNQGRGDSWIACGNIEEFNITNEKNLKLEEILEIKNKALLKQFYEVIYDSGNEKVNTEMLNIIFVVKKIYPNIDEQILLPLMKEYAHSAFIPDELILPLQNMLCQYNEKRVVKIFSEYEQDDFLEDTVIMYQRLFENDLLVDRIFPKQPKNIRELHTIFTRELTKVKQAKNNLYQGLDHLDKEKFQEMTIIVPKTSHDLIDVGNRMNICVGNGWYAEKIIKGQCNIVILIGDKGKFEYCVEFSKSGLIQSRGDYNKDMDSSMKKDLIKRINELRMNNNHKENKTA